MRPFRDAVRRVLSVVTVGALLGTGLVVGLSAPANAEETSAAVGAAELLDPASFTGLSADKAAASCWEIKQLNPESPSGTYWILTPAMTAPLQVFCDQVTDGGGWVKVGHGRNGWEEKYNGKGATSALLSTATGSSPTVQMNSGLIDDLLNDQSVSELTDGVRLKRATTADGSAWQEVRVKLTRTGGWKWTWASVNPVASYSFDGATGTGGSTGNYGSNDSFNRVDSSTRSDQAWSWGFAYGSGVAGTTGSTSYLWSATTGQGRARPVTELYVRPMVSNIDAGFIRIADTGTAQYQGRKQPSSFALTNPWGVGGLAGTWSGMSDVEVQAFQQVGNTMYVGGNFAYVQRDEAGTGRVNRPFLAAFNATTGEFIPSFAPVLNEAVHAISVLPNGNLFVGGRFTMANGSAVTGAVALNPTTGSTAPGFALTLENGTAGAVRVQAAAVSGQWTYIVGAFTHGTGSAGGRVFSRSLMRIDQTGRPDTNWRAEVKGSVRAVAVSQDASTTYVAGNFDAYRTTTTSSATAVSTAAGADLANPGWIPQWSNGPSYQQAVIQVGDRFWIGGSEHQNFSYDVDTYERLSGNITASQGGDFQSYATTGTEVFGSSHANQFNYSNSYTWPNVGSGWTSVDSIGWVGAWDAQTGEYIKTFNPHMSMRDGAGPWAMTTGSTDGTLWIGGDISGGRVTGGGGAWLGGFARYPQADIAAPNTPGNFRVTNQTATTATLAWAAPAGGVGSGGSYQVLRDDRVIATTTGTSLAVALGGERRYFVRAVDAAGNISASTPVLQLPGGTTPPIPAVTSAITGLSVTFDASATVTTQPAALYFWSFGDGTSETTTTPEVTHTYQGGGAYTVNLLVRDTSGAIGRGQFPIDVVQPTPSDAYGAAVFGTQPWAYWRLDEADSTMTAADTATGFRTATYQQGVSRGVEGIVAGNAAANFDGSNDVVVSTTQIPGPTTYSTEAWFKTTTNRGGKIIGFGSSASGLSNSYDRHVYMQNDGRLVFGAYFNASYTITSPQALNDGIWHHVVATQSSAGMVLYVDGVAVGTNPNTRAEGSTGYWRVGGDNTWGSSSAYFQGQIDEAAVYTAALTPAQVLDHYQTGFQLDVPVTSDPYAQEVLASTPSFYWRLDAQKYGVVTDASGNQKHGVVVSAPSFGGASAVTEGVGSIAFDGSDDNVAAGSPVQGPESYASEVWFQTTTNRGGKLMGFGNAKTGGSSSYDRHVYMLEDGRIVAGVYTGQLTTVTTPSSYNDGQWHHVVAQLTGGGAAGGMLSLYVDGAFIGSVTTPATVQQYSGYWRLGGDTTWGGAAYFSGNLDEFAVYPAPLTSGVIASHYAVGKATPNVPPVAEFTATPNYLEVGFDGTASQDPDGTIVSAVWEFGDGTPPVTGLSASHTYAAPGTFTAKLTVTDNRGGTHSAEKSVTVSERPNDLPTADAAVDISDLTLTVDASASTDPDGTIVGYLWEFGDGTTATTATATHAYSAAGPYTVKLTVTDNRGGTDTESVVVTASLPANQAPTAVAGATVSSLTVAVTAAGSTDPDGTITGYLWEFGDGAIATTADATHVYDAPGAHTITLTVTDNRGGTDTDTVTVTTVLPPNQMPTAVATATVNGLTAEVASTGSTDPDGTITGYAWSFGDGASATTASATHTYTNAGTYTIQLTVTDNRGGTATGTVDVTVGSPTASGVIVAENAAWKYYYAPAAPPAGWASRTFDDSSWNSGAAPIGYGTTLVATNLNPSSVVNDRPRAAYFRTEFSLTDVSKVTALELTGVADDGVVIYINGVEVKRQNMPATGAVTNLTFASSAIRTTVANSNPVTVSVPTNLLVTGRNVISAEAHVNYRGTPDLSFKLQANVTVSTVAPNQAPTAVITTSTSGLSVDASSAGSADSDGSITGYLWEFGDGATATTANASHAYSSAGVYSVKLTVTDNAGATTSATKQVTVGSVATTTELIAETAAWKYYYQATAPADGWNAVVFDDTTWASGAAPIGYGTTLVATDLAPTAVTNDRPRAAYFRTEFTLASAAKVMSLDLTGVADDGVVIYVNGVEVKRQNMPATGPITHLSFASSAIRTTVANANAVTVTVPTNLLVDGRNVITAETHVNYRGTPDMSFKMKASAAILP